MYDISGSNNNMPLQFIAGKLVVLDAPGVLARELADRGVLEVSGHIAVWVVEYAARGG
jgi:hypothetical protein